MNTRKRRVLAPIALAIVTLLAACDGASAAAGPVCLARPDGAGVRTDSGGSDKLVLEVAPGGRLLGSRQWGTAGDEAAARLAADACGNLDAVSSTMCDGFRRALPWFWRTSAA